MKPKEEPLSLFPILLFFVHIKRPNPNNPEGSTQQAQNPRQIKTQIPKTQFKKSTPKL